MERKPIYLAVTSIEPFIAKEFKDFKSAKKVESFAIIKKTFKRIHTTYSGNEYAIFNYSFLNVVEDLTKPFIINNWSIEDVYDGYFDSKKSVENGHIEVTSWNTWNDYKISDPNGELRTKYFESPEEAINNLVLFSKYRNWEDYELINPPKNK